MTFKPATWYPVAVVLSGINVVSAWFAAGEPAHAAVHVALAVAFGLWARRLRPRPGGSEVQIRSGAPEGLQAQVDALGGDMATLRRGLTEGPERLGFV